MENKGVPTVTVSQVNKAVALLIKGDKRFANVAVKGEIADFTRHYKSGHLYFTLRDESSQLKAVMWSSDAEGLEFEPKNGDKVVCVGALKVYEPSGVYQINCREMYPAGEGEAAKALLELIKKLDREGLFSRKRPLPAFPKKIAVITSAGGAALQDIINIISRRCPAAALCVIPAAVQGENAPQSIVKALSAAQDVGADVIIFGRGGGSSDDLSAFNDEAVARAVFASKIPTISAVGHETDTSIADLCADLRAPTPSAAAELAVPDLAELSENLGAALEGMRQRVLSRIAYNESALADRSRLIAAFSPKNLIQTREQRLDVLAEDISRKTRARLEKYDAELEHRIGIISALNPVETLKRGYSATTFGGKIISSAGELSVGDTVEIRFGEGSAAAEIKEVKNEEGI